jgi:hypothetical protein
VSDSATEPKSKEEEPREEPKPDQRNGRREDRQEEPKSSISADEFTDCDQGSCPWFGRKDKLGLHKFQAHDIDRRARPRDDGAQSIEPKEKKESPKGTVKRRTRTGSRAWFGGN